MAPHEGAMAMAAGAYNIALRGFFKDPAIGGTPSHVRDEPARGPGVPMIDLHHEGRKAAPAVEARDAAESREHLDLPNPALPERANDFVLGSRWSKSIMCGGKHLRQSAHGRRRSPLSSSAAARWRDLTRSISDSRCDA